MYILEELWDGNIMPSHRRIVKNSAYDKALRQSLACQDAFLPDLSEAGKEAFEQYVSHQSDMDDLSQCDHFIVGFRLGAKIMLDVLGEYHSPLPQIGSNI